MYWLELQNLYGVFLLCNPHENQSIFTTSNFPVNEKVVVGFSGGVDSVIAALLLREEGYEVQLVALDMGAFANDLFKQRVMIAADLLSLPVEIIAARDFFKQQIIDYLTESYLDGVTPNPCIRCNSRVKFSLLWHAGKNFNARWLATGHYVQLSNWGNHHPVISQGEDKTKEAKDAGADYVGASDLVDKVSKNWTDFDVAIATPDMMKEIGKIGKNILYLKINLFIQNKAYRTFLAVRYQKNNRAAKIVTRQKRFGN